MGCQRTRKAQIGSCNKCLCLILFLNKKKLWEGLVWMTSCIGLDVNELRLWKVVLI